MLAKSSRQSPLWQRLSAQFVAMVALSGLAGVPTVALGQQIVSPAPTVTYSTPSIASICQQAVRDLLQQEPELVTNALRQAQAKETTARQLAAARTIKSSADAAALDDQVPSIGPKDGKIVVEFFDYNCHFCKAFADQTATPLNRSRRDIRWVFIYTPILGSGSQRLAQFAAAAQLQGKFPEAHVFLMGQKETYGTAEQADGLRDALVQAAGLDRMKFYQALEDGTAKAIVDHHWAIVMQAGITGTPTLVAGGTVVPGFISLAQFADLLAPKGH